MPRAAVEEELAPELESCNDPGDIETEREAPVIWPRRVPGDDFMKALDDVDIEIVDVGSLQFQCSSNVAASKHAVGDVTTIRTLLDIGSGTTFTSEGSVRQTEQHFHGEWLAYP